MPTRADIDSLVTQLRALARAEHDDLTIGDEAADQIEATAAWLIGGCECPCCLGVEQCRPGCTFATDAPGDAERMDNVRSVLFGKA